MSIPGHGVPPRASRCPGTAGSESGAARPVLVPSRTPPERNNSSTDHAIRGKAGEDFPGVHRAVERTCRSVPPQEPQDLSWLSARLPKRSTCLLYVGYAQVFLATSGATPVLDEGD